MMLRCTSGRVIEIPDELTAGGCRFARMVGIIRDGLDYTQAKQLIPELDKNTHDVLMAIRRGTISEGVFGRYHADKRRETGDMRENTCKSMHKAGRTYKEISKATGLSVDSVRYYIHERSTDIKRKR